MQLRPRAPITSAPGSAASSPPRLLWALAGSVLPFLGAGLWFSRSYSHAQVFTHMRTTSRPQAGERAHRTLPSPYLGSSSQEGSRQRELGLGGGGSGSHCGVGIVLGVPALSSLLPALNPQRLGQRQGLQMSPTFSSRVLGALVGGAGEKEGLGRAQYPPSYSWGLVLSPSWSPEPIPGSPPSLCLSA